MQERLQKVLASAGVASRREAESLISNGKVTVNGEVIRELGLRVDAERDYIAVDGKPIARHVEHLYVLLHKPKGYVTTRHDPHVTNTVMELIIPALEEKFGRGDAAVSGLHPVGRLDAQSEGLLILTNDGSFTQEMTHPRHRVPKIYVAEVRGIPDAEALEKLRTGVPLFGQRTLPARARVVRADRGRNTARVEVEIREGRNQQVRRMLQAVGHPVDRLTRVGIGPVTLNRLKPGQWRFLTASEVETLRTRAANPDEETEQAPRRRLTIRRGNAGPGPKRPYVPGGPPRAQGPGGTRRPEGAGGLGRPYATGGSGRPQGGPGPSRPQGGSGPGRPYGAGPSRPSGGTERPYGSGPGRPQSGTERSYGSGPGRPQGGRGPERPYGTSGPGRPQGGRSPERPQGGGGAGRPHGGGAARPQGPGGPGRPYGSGPDRPYGSGPSRPQAPRGPSAFDSRSADRPPRPTDRDTRGGNPGRGGQSGSGRPQGGQFNSGRPQGGQSGSGRPHGGQSSGGRQQGGQSFGGRPQGGRPPSGKPQPGRGQTGRGKRQP